MAKQKEALRLQQQHHLEVKLRHGAAPKKPSPSSPVESNPELIQPSSSDIATTPFEDDIVADLQVWKPHSALSRQDPL